MLALVLIFWFLLLYFNQTQGSCTIFSLISISQWQYICGCRWEIKHVIECNYAYGEWGDQERFKKPSMLAMKQKLGTQTCRIVVGSKMGQHSVNWFRADWYKTHGLRIFFLLTQIFPIRTLGINFLRYWETFKKINFFHYIMFVVKEYYKYTFIFFFYFIFIFFFPNCLFSSHHNIYYIFLPITLFLSPQFSLKWGGQLASIFC